MSLKLKIKCDQCDDWFIEDWSKVLNSWAIRPGAEFGIKKIRFYALPTVHCAKCHRICTVELFEEVTETETYLNSKARLQ